jgi:hypothetical protein
VLVLAQVAMAVVPTVGAGPFGRSLAHLVAIDNGFAADRVTGVDLSMRGFSTQLVAGFAGLALLLSAVGAYGLAKTLRAE